MEFEIKDLCVVRETQTLLNKVTFTVQPNEFVCLIGPSGAGKSTLLRQICRLDAKTSGTVLWQGRDIAKLPVREYRRRVAYVFQKNVMFEGTVRDNLLASYKYGQAVTSEQINDLVPKCLDIAGLEADILDKDALSLSGGQQQRVGIARALMMRPSVLLLDEPTASLDVEVSKHFLQMLKKLKETREGQEGITIFMVTHRLEEAKFLADSILMLEAGKVVEFTEAKTFFSSPKTARAKTFLESEEL